MIGKSPVQSWYDELSDIKLHTLDALSYSLNSGQLQQVPKHPSKRVQIDPIDIACTACGAEPGERCTKVHRRYGKRGWRGSHFRRKDDANRVSIAAQALNPR